MSRQAGWLGAGVWVGRMLRGVDRCWSVVTLLTIHYSPINLITPQSNPPWPMQPSAPPWF